uniref:Uncharacterized protein n=1 Tax=Alexandrium andersonii TaxID=327968 RepID=A0A7S2G9V2_9DINO|mmetsp:Transcript_45904/g.104256  ORF Transcript_45904/g.104256 Transcript_45904/m.104256 type:complete len:151 (+) Transcript_45904:1-453(+)
MGGMGGMGMMGGMGGMGPMGGMGLGMGGMGPMGAMGGMGGMGMGMFGMGMGMGGSEVAFRMLLMSSSIGQAPGQLLLLLPAELLQKALVPHGHLADIAQKCQIRIDLGAEVSPNLLQVSLSGPVAANAMAAYFIQERMVQYGGGGGAGSQ